jgi:putative NADH-flavin reductase
MNLAVLGATGRTGQRGVAKPLRRDHRVIVVCRGLPPESTFPSEVHLETADLMHSAQVSAALAGADAVIGALGPRPPCTEVFCAQVALNLVEAMRERGLCCLVCLSVVGEYPAQRTVFMEWMAHRFRRQNPEGARD